MSKKTHKGTQWFNHQKTIGDKGLTCVPNMCVPAHVLGGFLMSK